MAVFVLNVVPPAMSILSRGCNASDGLLDVVVLSGNHAGHAMANVFSVLFGRHNRWPPMRTEELTIRCKSPIRPNIDGDPCQAMTCIRLRAKKVRCQRPAQRMSISLGAQAPQSIVNSRKRKIPQEQI